MTLTCEGTGRYRPGWITFYAKKGRSVDIEKIRESITATRLSGGTNMGVDYFEITAIGEIVRGDKETLLKVSGGTQQFILGEDPSARGTLQKLREAVERGENVANVTGRLPGWSGRFPQVLRALAATSNEGRSQLLVTAFAVSKK